MYLRNQVEEGGIFAKCREKVDFRNLCCSEEFYEDLTSLRLPQQLSGAALAVLICKCRETGLNNSRASSAVICLDSQTRIKHHCESIPLSVLFMKYMCVYGQMRSQLFLMPTTTIASKSATVTEKIHDEVTRIAVTQRRLRRLSRLVFEP
uniref:Uncharacterized protein n=1 Tax=Glossina pallidipes TaxID=7398 RepID=A0A1A9ZZ33_GLOPL